MRFKHQKFILSILNILMLSIIIVAVSIFFINDSLWIGPILILLALLALASLIPFKINIKSTTPDIIFGLIDNGILAILAIFGGHLAGVTGAIIGGVVGNAITDGVAGIFEGKIAEKLRLMLIPEERTMLKSAIGKMTGCLLAAGIILTLNSVIKF
jgi:hypothetical protein